MQIDGAVEVSVLLRCGVYFLLHRGAVVYIGQSKVMLTRLASHRSSWGRKRTEAQPRGVIFDAVWVLPCKPEEVDQIEQIMIARYRPRYNRQHNSGLPPDINALLASLVPQLPATPEPRQPIYRRL